MSAVVDGGPTSIAQGPYSPDNYLYVTVTVCAPGTTTCVTVDHVQVSTATTGLRVLYTAVAGLPLVAENDPNTAGNTLSECYQLPVGTAWGAVAAADIEIGGEKAASVPIQILVTPNATPNAANCVNNGFIRGDVTAGVQQLGANGVIGLGTLVNDCTGAACVSQYFTCNPNNGNCQTNVAKAPPTTAQVTNPVTMFTTDKNGVIIKLPAVDPAKGAPAGLTGSITFGIGTEANNALSGITSALAADPFTGLVATTYKSQTAGSQPVKYLGWFDTGSVPYVFTDGGIKPMCTSSGLTAFYCPAQPLNLQATITGGNGTATVPFTVANAETLSSTNPSSIVFSTLAATSEPNTGFGPANGFIWGLPFFFGRTMFIAYPGANITGPTGEILVGPSYGF